VKIKSLPIGQVKAGPEDGLAEGEFIVYPSTFTRKADSYGDVVAKGAFVEDIAARKDAGNVLPGLYGHRMDDPDFFVAEAHEEAEDDHGWRIKGAFDLESPKGAQVYRLVKGRRLNQLSFAYDVLESGMAEDEDGEAVNELRKLKVYEFSFVPVGANQDTSVVAVKAIVDGIKAGRTLSAKNESALREARDSIDSVLSSLADDEDGKAAPAADRCVKTNGRTCPMHGVDHWRDTHDQEKASGDAEAKSGASDEEPAAAKSSASDEEPKPSPSVARLAAQAHIYALSGQEGVPS
jgi:HK97 family phage prohead protease